MRCIGNITQAMTAFAALASLTVSASAFTPPTYDGLVYATPGPRHELDLYIPTSNVNPCVPLPVVLFFYGGGWLVGDKADVAPYVDSLLARGFAVASANYRYSYQAIFPAQIHDCKGAIRWLKANAATYNLDSTRIAVFGDSAGGHLAALVGTSADVPALEGEIGGNLRQTSAVQIAATFAGPTDLIAFTQNDPHSNSAAALFGAPNWFSLNLNDPQLVALMQSADPATHASINDPPFHIVHGANDTVVPPSQAQHLHDALVAVGATSTLYMLTGVGHEIRVSNFETVFDAFAQLLITPHNPGDVTCDGVTNVADLLMVITNWGACPAPPVPCNSDLNHDAQVNVADLLIVIQNWSV